MCQTVFQRFTHLISRSSSFISEHCVIFPSDRKSVKWEYSFKNTSLHSAHYTIHARSYSLSMHCITCKNKQKIMAALPIIGESSHQISIIFERQRTCFFSLVYSLRRAACITSASCHMVPCPSDNRWPSGGQSTAKWSRRSWTILPNCSLIAESSPIRSAMSWYYKLIKKNSIHYSTECSANIHHHHYNTVVGISTAWFSIIPCLISERASVPVIRCASRWTAKASTHSDPMVK